MKLLTIEPRSKITGWAGWPADVRATLRDWNRSRRLSFVQVGGRVVFQCEACERWHDPAVNGVGVLDGRALCDGCLVVVARTSAVAA